MIPYWLVFIAAVWLAVTESGSHHPSRVTGAWPLVFLILLLMIGLRHGVGGDWGMYQIYLNLPDMQSFEGAMSHGDQAYNLLNWIANDVGWDIHFVNFVCAILFSWGLIAFCRAQPRPYLALVVALPYLVIVVAMGYTRQGVAIGLAMLGLVALSERKLLRFVIFVVLAATFHKSAVILMPLAVLAGTRQKLWTVLWVALASLMFYFLMLNDSVEYYNNSYLQAEYAAQGAAIRVAMNAVPAILFLWYRRRFELNAADRTFWSWMSYGALLFIALMAISPSSTAVDRIALYWIPLQLYVLSRLPDAAGRPAMAVGWISAYSGAVLFVWLFYAVNAKFWIPYRFYPWELAWQ